MAYVFFYLVSFALVTMFIVNAPVVEDEVDASAGE